MASRHLDTERLLRDLSATIAATGSVQAAKREPDDLPGGDPYRHRLASNLSTLTELGDDPARPYLGAWVVWLLLGRTSHEVELSEEVARRQPIVKIELPAPDEVSLRQAVRSLLGAVNAEERRRLADAIAVAAPTVGGVAVELWMRRAEALRRAGGDAVVPLVTPLPSLGDLATLAEHVLTATDDLASQVLRGAGGQWAEALALGAGRDTDVPWPRAITTRWLLDPFEGEARWFDMPALSLGRMPTLLGGSSITRALARLGARWADGARSRQLPRALAELPSGLARLRSGALFASLLQADPFLVRGLGMSRPEAVRARRQQARVALVALRLEAARALTFRVALTGDRSAMRAEAATQVPRALMAKWPAELTLALPRITPTTPARLLSFGLGALDARAMRDAHDVDWFRNPRAVIALRHGLDRAPPTGLTADEARAALTAAVDDLTANLG